MRVVIAAAPGNVGWVEADVLSADLRSIFAGADAVIDLGDRTAVAG